MEIGYVDYRLEYKPCPKCAEKDAEIEKFRSIASQNANTAEFLLKERDELRAKLDKARVTDEALKEIGEE